MGELDLIRHFRAQAPAHPWLLVGPGQDCAILRWKDGRDIAFKIDQVVEGTHFVLSGANAATPFQIGWKAMAKACSDIAATGFTPVAATVAVNLRKETPESLTLELYAGIKACCERFSFALAGGDIASSENGLSVVVSLLGEGPANGAWLRSGAKTGDVLLVTGSLGGSRARKHLDFLPRLPESAQIRALAPGGVHACIDITDGLSRDLYHICEESRCGARIIEKSIPYSPDALAASAQPGGRTPLDQALADGEDFELLLAVEPSATAQLLQNWRGDVALTQFGVIQEAEKGCVLIGVDGRETPLKNVGYEHLAL